MTEPRRSSRQTSETVKMTYNVKRPQDGPIGSDKSRKRQRVTNYDTDDQREKEEDTTPGDVSEAQVNTARGPVSDHTPEEANRPYNRITKPDSVLYGHWKNTEFNDQASVHAHLHKVRWVPNVHASQRPKNHIPSNYRERSVYAKQVYDAMIDFHSGFVDKLSTLNKKNRLINQEYTQPHIQASCLELIANAVDLHGRGCTLLPQRDPTMAASKTSKEAGNMEGEERYRIVKGGQEQRDLAFSDRISRVCAAVRHSKACATAVLDGDGKRLLTAPDLVVKGRKAYMKGNDNKQAALRGFTQQKNQTQAPSISYQAPSFAPANDVASQQPSQMSRPTNLGSDIVQSEFSPSMVQAFHSSSSQPTGLQTSSATFAAPTESHTAAELRTMYGQFIRPATGYNTQANVLPIDPNLHPMNDQGTSFLDPRYGKGLPRK